MVPETGLVLGELKQDHTVLDPYLLIEAGDESYCLGIWDDGTIIASPAQH
jgi:hypothetical protein